MGRFPVNILTKFLLTLVLIAAANPTTHAQKRMTDNLPRLARVIPDFSAARLMSRLDEMALHHVEGIWQFPATGVEVAIVRRQAESVADADNRVYDMIVVNTPNRSVRPGTVMGAIVPSGSRGEYDARIYTKMIGSRPAMPSKFTLSLSGDDSTFELKPVRGRMVYNLWRLLPYLWRYAVYPSREPTKTDGCVRIYPNPPLPFEPVYF